MPKLAHEGNTKVHFLPDAVSLAAPTVANITAGTNLTRFVTKDGVATPNNQNMIDSANIDEVFDSQEVGSYGGSPLALTMFRDDTDDEAWELIEYGTRGFVLICRRGVPILASNVEMYAVAMHAPVPLDTATNEMQKFKAMFAVTQAPNLNAVVAA